MYCCASTSAGNETPQQSRSCPRASLAVSRIAISESSDDLTSSRPFDAPDPRHCTLSLKPWLRPRPSSSPASRSVRSVRVHAHAVTRLTSGGLRCYEPYLEAPGAVRPAAGFADRVQVSSQDKVDATLDAALSRGSPVQLNTSTFYGNPPNGTANLDVIGDWARRNEDRASQFIISVKGGMDCAPAVRSGTSDAEQSPSMRRTPPRSSCAARLRTRPRSALSCSACADATASCARQD